MRVLMAGASGLIGRALRRHLLLTGHEVRALVRHEATTEGECRWTGRPGSVPPQAVAWADAVVSLSGAPIARLVWTKEYRQRIMSSRVDATSALAVAIGGSARPPAVWVSASATGWYGNDTRPTGPGGHVEPLTEKAGSGTGLLAAVARGWEAAALPAASATRLVRVRTGVVLAAQGGLLPPLITMAKAGLGGRFGTGRQYWPWISLQDEVRAWGFALERESLSGPVNLVGPSLASAGQITRSVAGQLGRPHWLALPSSPLRAVPGGSASELILASQPIRPAVLQAHGFQFLDQTVDQAIRAALNP